MRQSSINPRPTFLYSQPEAYRFSHDSVFLAQQVLEMTKDRLSRESAILDLCAGCGIVGLDFLYHCKVTPSRCDFIEIQGEYKGHFNENARRLQSSVPLQFINTCYSTLLNQAGSIYDLILCNPPYFRVGQGRLPESEFKQRCRFFIDSDFATLMLSIVHALKPQGEAYVLLRESLDHGRSTFTEAQETLQGLGHISIVGDIRGTPLAQISREATRSKTRA